MRNKTLKVSVYNSVDQSLMKSVYNFTGGSVNNSTDMSIRRIVWNFISEPSSMYMCSLLRDLKTDKAKRLTTNLLTRDSIKVKESSTTSKKL